MKKIKEVNTYSAEERIAKTNSFAIDVDKNFDLLLNYLESNKDSGDGIVFKTNLVFHVLYNIKLLKNWNNYNNNYIINNNLSECDDEYNSIYINPNCPEDGEISTYELTENIFARLERLNALNDMINESCVTNEDLEINDMLDIFVDSLEEEKFEEMDGNENLPC